MSENRWTAEDERFMALALTLAEKGYGNVSPNPYVGAILVKEGRIIGEGYHQKAGDAHAEVNAIHAAKKHASEAEIEGSTIYVTLEPCCHVGKTGACTEAIVNAGITRVVSAMEDPNPKVGGQGHAYLKAQGIDVATGLLEARARHINRHFIHNQLTKRPFVTLKAALSLDGKLATKTGVSQWITCPKAREKTHYIRGLHDAILIGKGTLIADNPSLTVRYGYEGFGKAPLRVVLIQDFTGVSEDLTLFNDITADESTQLKTLVITTESAIKQAGQLIETLTNQGVEIVSVDEESISIESVLDVLTERGIMSVMLEGGAGIYDAFLNAGYVDELALFYGPRLIGDRDAYELWATSDTTALERAPILTIFETERVGESLYVGAFFKGDV
ncbi:MAG: bifunctional diaminohydroxyphosphoribosylaminopyrimidine deaminase/5-amino-6-(5-phosphoribosylamino)uracil reductase RibD [Xanthomonadaceae bacterium]|nr:bifunctional diaminohydroxyphosphoribosylaminopyrimidine deaminase/5-amino-6-(5-phosphoribosylamino)uracil reductase RibD [Xanthomonadaceae bacterium]